MPRAYAYNKRIRKSSIFGRDVTCSTHHTWARGRAFGGIWQPFMGEGFLCLPRGKKIWPRGGREGNFFLPKFDEKAFPPTPSFGNFFWPPAVPGAAREGVDSRKYNLKGWTLFWTRTYVMYVRNCAVGRDQTAQRLHRGDFLLYAGHCHAQGLQSDTGKHCWQESKHLL